MSATNAMSQSAAVVKFTKQVLGDRFESGMDAREIVTKDDRKAIIGLLVAGFAAKEIELSSAARSKHDSEAKLRTYSSGLTTNWLNKSKELNGGVKYEAKNPGVRSGSPELRQALALKAELEAQGKDTTEVDAYIESVRPTAVKSAKTPKMDFSSLPEELQELARSA